MRRLNRREYAASIKHLFGFEPELYSIPEDDGVEPYDTTGSEQFFTSSHFEDYYELGQTVLATVVGELFAGGQERVGEAVEHLG